MLCRPRQFQSVQRLLRLRLWNKIIKLTARILRDVVFDCCLEGFVGHIAGDDFIFVVPRELVDKTCGWVIKTFDSVIPYRYAEDDAIEDSLLPPAGEGRLRLSDPDDQHRGCRMRMANFIMWVKCPRCWRSRRQLKLSRLELFDRAA